MRFLLIAESRIKILQRRNVPKYRNKNKASPGDLKLIKPKGTNWFINTLTKIEKLCFNLVFMSLFDQLGKHDAFIYKTKRTTHVLK